MLGLIPFQLLLGSKKDNSNTQRQSRLFTYNLIWPCFAGVVKDKRTIWRLSIISDFFRAVVNFIRIFFQTMFSVSNNTEVPNVNCKLCICWIHLNLTNQNIIIVLGPFRWKKQTATGKDMVLVRNGMVDPVVVDAAPMAAEVAAAVEALAAAVHVVLARYLTFDPMTTVCIQLFPDYIILFHHCELLFSNHQCSFQVLSLLVDPAVANKRTTILPDDCLTDEYTCSYML